MTEAAKQRPDAKAAFESGANEARAEVREIVKACEAAGVLHLVGQFLGKKMDAAAVRQYLARQSWRKVISQIEQGA